MPRTATRSTEERAGRRGRARATSEDRVSPRSDQVAEAAVLGPPPGAARRDRKRDVLSRHTASTVGSIADAVVIKDGEPFFLCPPDGQIPTEGEHGLGLYHHDTRFLNGYELTIGGIVGNSLAATAVT